jgi:spermidine/putrescine transport system permease protein
VGQLAPGALYYLAFFLAPLAVLFAYSFWIHSGFDVIRTFTLDNYITGLTTSVYADVLVRTVAIGLATASIVVVIVYVLAYVMLFVFEKRAGLLLNLVLISMFSGYLVRIYAWRTILGRDGLLNSALQQLHLIDQPVRFLIYSPWAVVITLTELLIPLALLPVFSSMSNVSKQHLEVARDLGSTGFRLHRTILIPMLLPGLTTAFALSFILAAGDFVVPSLVGGTQGIMVGNLVADQFNGLGSNWPLGSALAFLIVGIVVVICLTTNRVIRLLAR